MSWSAEENLCVSAESVYRSRRSEPAVEHSGVERRIAKRSQDNRGQQVRVIQVPADHF